MNITEHSEKYLGRISEGWRDSEENNGMQIVAFRGVPAIAECIYMTLGLSNHEVNIGGNGKTVRQELMLPTVGHRDPAPIVSMLLGICETILGRHRGVLRGQVLKVPAELVRNIGFDAVYCSIPVFMDDGFRTFHESKPATVFVWLIPIYSVEAEFVETRGWEAFEDLMEAKDPSLLVRNRPSMI